MRRSQRRFIRWVLFIIVIALIAFVAKRHYWPASQPADTQPAKPEVNGLSGPTDRMPTTQDAPPTPTPTVKKASPADRSAALALLEQGMGLYRQKKHLDARSTLADALNTSALPEKQAETARAKLSELADRMLFSRKVFPNDPCTFAYTFQSGDVPVRVERKLKLRVPAQLIQKINNIPDATKIQIGQTLKLIRGPFHAVISKSRCVMDVFLEEPKTGGKIFVRRFRVGVGMDGSTPAGQWCVSLGGKMTHAPWTPPASSNLPRKRIQWGQPGYPLGKMGYWISIEGIGKTPYTREDGYGIHGTNNPDSIGKASSLGCIRLADDDIEMVFAMLYEKWSTVTVLP
ncbi:MAG: L,D-transpeptidase family protein [Planctomycetota bacterium]|nr:L,D-transpeptidase family protein [Planctomycetota bacterium]